MEFLYWEMENGHQHSFMTCDEDIMSEFATINKKGELNQKQYQEFVAEKEHTRLAEEKIIKFDELTEEIAEQLLNEDMIADYENDAGTIIPEFF